MKTLQTETAAEVIRTIRAADLTDLSISQAEKMAKEIYEIVSSKDQDAFAKEWLRQVEAVVPTVNSIIKATSFADIAMIGYARRFF